MRKYRQPAEVTVDDDGQPARFTAWGRTYLVVEVLGPHWESLDEWWTNANVGRSLEELTVRHYLVRAHGVQRDAVVALEQHADGWLVVGVED
ncbi:hypothetical protein [Microbispora sp. ATCC PTA-5024]|uniref:hypothetical protein n=1 Tax=Microbispora sp. ATCC PTA-5024 TaxID=316330 RepID=UPI0003DC675C|nr:hypothetical protein [Microbispora sp. ATCC PTA-5024]ETK36146.1 nucleotidyltransferase [Microbispora sp. ATCC PTA-5024]